MHTRHVHPPETHMCTHIRNNGKQKSINILVLVPDSKHRCLYIRECIYTATYKEIRKVHISPANPELTGFYSSSKGKWVKGNKVILYSFKVCSNKILEPVWMHGTFGPPCPQAREAEPVCSLASVGNLQMVKCMLPLRTQPGSCLPISDLQTECKWTGLGIGLTGTGSRLKSWFGVSQESPYKVILFLFPREMLHSEQGTLSHSQGTGPLLQTSLLCLSF